MNKIYKYMIISGLIVFLTSCGSSIAVDRGGDSKNTSEKKSSFVHTAQIMYMEYNYVSNLQLGSKGTKSTYPGENTKKPKDLDTYYISGVKYNNSEISSMKIEKSDEVITVDIDKSSGKVMIVMTNKTDRLVKELSLKDFMVIDNMPLAE